jgi:hypothetical protein
LASSKRGRKWGGSAGKVVAILAAIVVIVLGILAAPYLLVDVNDIPVVKASRPQPTPVSRDYAGSLTCVECHREICEKYLSHPMNQAMDAMPQSRPIEDLTQPPFPEGRLLQYHVEERDKRLVHHETFKSEEGKIIYDAAEPISFVIGSGQRGRTYLVKRGDMFFQSPIGWYTSVHKWDLSPGYKYPQNERFERRVGVGCLYCHAGILNPNPDNPDTFRDPAIVELPISCERCHGPAKKHVEYQRLGTLPAGEVDPIVNPAKLDPMRREHVCDQCHLLGEAVVPRYGRTHADFRPGMLLDDVWTVFVSKHGAESRGAKAVSHVEQMQASRCYQQSKGMMGCTSCHDPHSKPKPEERVAHFDGRCKKCHEQTDCRAPDAERNAAPANGSCIACHMPGAPAGDVAHTALTDHRILSKPLEFPLKTTRETTPLADLVVFDGGQDRLPAAEVDRGKAILLTNRAGATKIESLDQVVTRLLIPPEDIANGEPITLAAIHDDVPALHALAFSYLLSDQKEKAIELWERILEVNPNDANALSSLFRENLEEDPQTALKLSDRLLRINPNDAMIWGRRAYTLGKNNRDAEAIEAAEQALKLDPRLTQIREWLIERYSAAGKVSKTEEQRELLRDFERAAAKLDADLKKERQPAP